MKPKNCYSCSSFGHHDIVEKRKDFARYTSVPWCRKLNKETNGLAPICADNRSQERDCLTCVDPKLSCGSCARDVKRV